MNKNLLMPQIRLRDNVRLSLLPQLYLRLFYFMTYSEKLQDPRWQKKRLEILERDKFTCVCCGDTTTMLQVHHLAYSGNPWDVENDKLITTCKHCHAAIECRNIKWENDFVIKKMRIPNNENGIMVLFITKEFISFIELINNPRHLVTITNTTFNEISTYINAS